VESVLSLCPQAHREETIEAAAERFDCNKTKAVLIACEVSRHVGDGDGRQHRDCCRAGSDVRGPRRKCRRWSSTGILALTPVEEDVSRLLSWIPVPK